MDSKATDEAEKPDIEVTPEMIEAGIVAFAGCYPDAASDGEYAEAAVKSIFLAMLAARPKTSNV
ncbi:hypothetical protein [Caudoviricetes sp.]|nr:hypothetical protein [Caudoviricetes sp.]